MAIRVSNSRGDNLVDLYYSQVRNTENSCTCEKRPSQTDLCCFTGIVVLCTGVWLHSTLGVTTIFRRLIPTLHAVWFRAICLSTVSKHDYCLPYADVYQVDKWVKTVRCWLFSMSRCRRTGSAISVDRSRHRVTVRGTCQSQGWKCCKP